MTEQHEGEHEWVPRVLDWEDVDGARCSIPFCDAQMDNKEMSRRLNEWETLKRLSAVQITCLCGSSRFTDIMAVVGWLLERDENRIVTGLHLLPQWYPNVPEHHLAETEGVAERLDELHLRKIDIADEVFVIDRQGYIGESTSREIEYATINKKPIRYLTREDAYSDFVHNAIVAYADIREGK